MLLSFRQTLIGCAVALSTVFTAAQADVTGLWQGYGSWTYDGSSIPCLLTIRFEENESHVRRHKGQLQCDILTMHSDPLLWQKNGSELLLEGEAAGSWSDAGIKTEELAGENIKVSTDLNAVTGEYHEVWSRVSDGAIFYDIRANLKRSK